MRTSGWTHLGLAKPWIGLQSILLGWQKLENFWIIVDIDAIEYNCTEAI